MDEIKYGMTQVGEFLGISRQGAYLRMDREGWEGIEGEGNNIRVPSSEIKKSRDLERQKLLERVDRLDALASLQMMEDDLQEKRNRVAP